MSLDADPHQRRWLALGHGGETSSPLYWRYWKTADRRWIISAPHGMAEFELQHRTVFHQGVPFFEAVSQWQATWRAVAYFYSDVVPGLPPPPLSSD